MSIALWQRNDFPQLIEMASRERGIPNPVIVEKDYYVTEALRLISQRYQARTLFKGGTSLSKGWGIIKRFSEDIDLYIDPAPSKNGTERLLKEVANHVSSVTQFEGPLRVEGIQSVARSTKHPYKSTFKLSEDIEASVLLELGIQSGTYPVEVRAISSILASVLNDQNVQGLSEDCKPFEMRLLHFKRTALEKMFAIHHKVERGYLEQGHAIGSYARHYYDIGQLLQQSEVQSMLEQGEHHDVCRSYRDITSRFFPEQLLPDKMNLGRSRALYPDNELRAVLAEEYEKQCRVLCYSEYPSFLEVLGALEDIRTSFEDVD